MTTIEEAVRNIYEGPALHRRPDVPDNVIFVMDTRSIDRQVIDDLDTLVEASDDLKEKVEEVSKYVRLLALGYRLARQL